MKKGSIDFTTRQIIILILMVLIAVIIIFIAIMFSDRIQDLVLMLLPE